MSTNQSGHVIILIVSDWL